MGFGVVVNAGEEHANAVPLLQDTEDGDAIELKGDKLEVEEPNERGLGAVAKMLVLGATITATIPACAAAVFSMSEPECRNSSVPPSIGVIIVCIGWPVDDDEDVEDGGDISMLYNECPSFGDCASELCESSSMVM